MGLRHCLLREPQITAGDKFNAVINKGIYTCLQWSKLEVPVGLTDMSQHIRPNIKARSNEKKNIYICIK